MRALGITDGSAGMVAQVRALANVLGAELELKTVVVNKAWRYLPNKAFDWGLVRFFPVSSDTLPTPYPDLVISCGRKGALVAANIREGNKAAKFIHIQDPQMSPGHFDVIIAMEHDKVRGPNIIRTEYALHDITPHKLAEAKALWEPFFAHLPKPWHAVLIGGSTNKYRMTKAATEKLIAEMEKIGGTLLITTSRRTGTENIRLLEARYRGSKHFLFTSVGDNPYLGMLACADKIYVTNDSVNMMSEAAASGKPVLILPLLGHENTKPARFAERITSLESSPQAMMERVAKLIGEMLARRA